MSAGFKEGERFDLLIGTGEHRGLVRLKRNKKGTLTAIALGKGGITFNAGFIERFGTEPEKREPCNAEPVDADTVEVVLPKWADEAEA